MTATEMFLLDYVKGIAEKLNQTKQDIQEAQDQLNLFVGKMVMVGLESEDCYKTAVELQNRLTSIKVDLKYEQMFLELAAKEATK